MIVRTVQRNLVLCNFTEIFLLENPAVVHILQIFATFYEALSSSIVFTTDPYPEPN
jgi:hypothetical protein